MNNHENNPLLWLTILSLSDQATRDGLTNLYNRRYFEETLADHIESAKRYDRELSLVIFDIDRFKQINDSNGHRAGDLALKYFATRLTTTARSADIVCRIGGDEFAVILPETGILNARTFAERVTSSQIHPTVTAGTAALPDPDLFDRADADLIAKKR